MNMRNRHWAAVAALVLTTSACDSLLTDINQNPNAPESVPVTNLLLGGIRDVAQNAAERGAFGKWTMLYHGENWAQHVAQPVYNDEDFYIPRAGIPDVIWDDMYFALSDLATAKSLADASGDDNIWAIAEIMTVYGFMILTDYFGDIPYSEALNLDAGVSYPAYDSQATIYPDLIARLGAAAGRIDTGAFITFQAYDPVYAGDMNGWLLFANSLRLRLAMRMVNDMAGPAQAAFEAAWADGVFASVADEADVDWNGTQPAANPVYEAIVYAGRPGDFRMSESLIDRLAALNDPRLPIYAEPAESDAQYRGLRNGLLPGEYTPARTAGDFSTIGAYFLDASTPSDLMSYSEVLFLGAEAAARGWAVGSTAATLYAAGITASMESVGVAPGDITTYLAQASVGYATGTYQGLDAIRVQKWISLYFAGPEAFADLRRTGFDWTTDAGTTGTDLLPAANSDIGPTFPARLFYPQNEALRNPDNYPGDAELTDVLWWMP
jgi:hypothetical protein